MYGAGMIPGRSVNSANSSGVHFNANHTSKGGSRGMAAYIFPPTLKTRSCPHWTISVVWGSVKQNRRTHSTLIFLNYTSSDGYHREPARLQTNVALLPSKTAPSAAASHSTISAP